MDQYGHLWENLVMNLNPTLKFLRRFIPLPPEKQLGPSGVVFFFLLYILLDWITYVNPSRFGITPFNPEAAIALVILMLGGIRYWPVIFLAAIWGEFALPTEVRPLGLILINGGVLAAGFCLMSSLLCGRYRIDIELETRQNITRLIGVSLIGMLFMGIAYVFTLVTYNIGPMDRYFFAVRRFFIGYSVGILVAAPFLLMLQSDKRCRELKQLFFSRLFWLQVISIFVCLWWIFLSEENDRIRNFYVLFLPLIWTATCFGLRGAVSALMLIQCGIFVIFHIATYQPLSMFELQLLLMTLVLTGLLLGVSIDEQRRATNNFRDSLKLAAAGELSAAITHEINQPLTALSGYASAGQQVASRPEVDRLQLNSIMQKIMDETKRTAAVVRRLRDFFRQGDIYLESTEINDFVMQVILSVKSKATEAGVDLQFKKLATTTVVLVDLIQMEVVLRNLLINAIESVAQLNKEDGWVSVLINSDSPNEVRIEVADNGSGIRSEDVERMFDSFVSTKSNGMGMGLAISRAIIRAHGGKIWANPGQMGNICFTLPIGDVLANESQCLFEGKKI